MKNSKKKMILLTIAGILIVILIYSYIHYLNVKLNNEHATQFQQDLLKVMAEDTNFNMLDVTRFEWDKMYVFRPYTSSEEMYNATGREWTNRSFIGYYLLRNTIFDKYPLDDDPLNKLVFMEGDKVVLDVTFNRSEVDLTHLDKVILHEEATFTVVDNHILKQD